MKSENKRVFRAFNTIGIYFLSVIIFSTMLGAVASLA